MVNGYLEQGEYRLPLEKQYFNMFKRIINWFKKKKNSPKNIMSEESKKTLQATVDHYISWYKGENPLPLDIGNSIWFIQIE